MSQSPEAAWRDALRDGRFVLQRARDSGHIIFPPRLMEPGSGDEDLEWVDASGLGTVYALTLIAPKPPSEPYNVALVDLDDGPRMMSRVEGVDADQLRIGMRVQARIEQGPDGALLLFDPV